MITGIYIYSILGWIGVILIIIGYILYSTKILKINYVLYHLINLLGAIGLVISTFMTESWPAMALSLIFVGISMSYIIKILSIKPAYRELRAD